MTKHKIGKEKWKKRTRTRKKADFSCFYDKKRRNQLFRLKNHFFSGGKLKTYPCLRVFPLTRHPEQFVAVHWSHRYLHVPMVVIMDESETIYLWNFWSHSPGWSGSSVPWSDTIRTSVPKRWTILLLRDRRTFAAVSGTASSSTYLLRASIATMMCWLTSSVSLKGDLSWWIQSKFLVVKSAEEGRTGYRSGAYTIDRKDKKKHIYARRQLHPHQ